MVAPGSAVDGRCPVCRGARLERLLFVEGVPVHQNVFAPTRDAARAVARGTLDFRWCAACGLAHNAAFDASRLRYDAAYEVDQSHSARFLAHLDDVCGRVAARATAPLDVLEIGCGQGTFLAHLGLRLGARLRSAVGFDPAFRGRVALPSQVRVIARAFDAGAIPVGTTPQLVVLRHTLEHVADPVAFLRSVRARVAGGPFDLLVETPDADYPLRRRNVHDFYYEHCSLLSARALWCAMAAAGFSAIHVDRVFDGEYLLAFGTCGQGAPARTGAAPANLATTAHVDAFVAASESFAARWRAKISEARARGGVAVWGGAGKGVTFVGLVDPAADLLEAVVDIHPAKEGKFVPGTGHRIVAPDGARALGVMTVVAANDRYVVEIADRCRSAGWDAAVWSASVW